MGSLEANEIFEIGVPLSSLFCSETIDEERVLELYLYRAIG
jgi:hypothetical protein